MSTSMEQNGAHREQALIGKAKAGCNSAFTQLVDRYHGQILRCLARHTSDHELAADLTQETFLDAYRRLKRYHSDRPFAAWLFRIAHYNLLRTLDSIVAQVGDACHALNEPDQSGPAHERAVFHQALTPTLRQPLLLQSVYGFTSQDIADSLESCHSPCASASCGPRSSFASTTRQSTIPVLLQLSNGRRPLQRCS